MPAGACGKNILTACSCSLLDVCGANLSLSGAGSSSLSWVIVGTYAWLELGGGVTCEKKLGVRYGNFFSMVFSFSIRIQIIPFGVGIRKEMYRFFPGNFRDSILLTCPCSMICLSISVCSSINCCSRFRDTFFTLLLLLPMMTPLTCLPDVFALRTRFFLTGPPGCALALARSIS